MTDIQRKFIGITAALVILMILLPPVGYKQGSEILFTNYAFLPILKYKLIDYSRLLLQIVTVLIASTAIYFVHFHKAEPTSKPKAVKRDALWLRAIDGEEPLWKVYWLYGVLVTAITAPFFSWIFTRTGAANTGLEQLTVIAVLLYLVWWSVAVWKCSKNTGSPVWTLAARAVVLLLPVFLLNIG